MPGSPTPATTTPTEISILKRQRGNYYAHSAQRISLSELPSGVPAGPPHAQGGRLSCLLPQTQRRRVRSAFSVKNPALLLACHVKRSRDISRCFRLQRDQK